MHLKKVRKNARKKKNKEARTQKKGGGVRRERGAHPNAQALGRLTTSLDIT
jgi:hypothetical protein